MSKQLFDLINEKEVYRVPRHRGPINGIVNVPGSKSITNRALLFAALSNGTAHLSGVLFSDDSRHFLSSLVSLGFDVTIDEEAKEVSVKGLGGLIPNKEASINVGSAGTAARFLTAMLAFSSGEYIINCSEQMKKRPMKPLFDALISVGASFEYLEKEDYLPVKVIGNQGNCHQVSMDITKSTQFLSALLMVAPMTKKGMKIHITSEKTGGAYIEITRHMMAQFGVEADYSGGDYHVPEATSYSLGHYHIEPDMSAACYYYSIAALTGGTMTVKGVHHGLIQGDIKFLDVLEQLGSTITSTPEGLELKGPDGGNYKGITVNMNNFSDQTMTLSVLAAYASSPSRIEDVSHIRVQECDRMQAIVNELTRVGIDCKADGTNIDILPGPVKPGSIQTYEDHRMAMAFSLLGLRTEGIVIEDPRCCKKTFENYFEVFDDLLAKN